MTTDNDKTDPPVQAPAEASSGTTPPAADAAPPQPSTPAPAETPTVVDPLVQVTAERDHLKEQLLRTAADFDNYRKRARREMEEARMRGKDDAVRDILPVFDNLERAVAASDSAQSIASVVEGVKMVLKLFQDTTERMGLARVPTVGHRFDPAMHEAIQQKETEEAAAGTILTEVTPGYMFGQRLLRAAMVVVARKPAAPKPPEAAAEPVQSAAVSGSPSQPAVASGSPTQPPKADEAGAAAADAKPEGDAPKPDDDGAA